MKTTRSTSDISPVIAAALRRRPRHLFLQTKGRKAANNYLAEKVLSTEEVSANAKKPGARAGNRNAWRHGFRSAYYVAHRRNNRRVLRDAYALLAEVKGLRRARKEQRKATAR